MQFITDSLILLKSFLTGLKQVDGCEYKHAIFMSAYLFHFYQYILVLWSSLACIDLTVIQLIFNKTKQLKLSI